MIFQHARFQIWNKNQHPYKHALSDFAYTNAALPGVTNLGGAFDYLVAVLYPQSKASVANVAALPALGNTINDMRVVLDDGDGKAAAYRWEQREGEASPSWHKIYDVDWGTDSILQGFLLKTQDIYVKQWGYDDLDATGAAIAGTLAGQSIYGGSSAGTNLTLFANSGDGVGADTGFVQFGDNVRPTADSAYSLGTTTERFLKGWFDEGQFGTLNISGGSITDASGAISFDNENLSTNGSIASGTLLLGSGSITDSSGTINFSNEHLTTTGVGTFNSVTATGAASAFAASTTIANFTFTNGNIASASAALSFNALNLSTSGSITGGTLVGSTSTRGGNLLLSAQTLSSTNANGNILIVPNGTGIVDIQKAMTTIGQTVSGTLAVTGLLTIDNLSLDGNTLSSTNVNGDITIDPNGIGDVVLSARSRPDTNNVVDLGASTARWNTFYLGTAISDGTTLISSATLQSLRDINVGVASGMTIFWNGTKWVASAPDTEIDHGTVSGLLDDDHTQYALLAGRSGGQTLIGGTAASNSLALQSTSNATKGFITTDSVIRGTGDNTIDSGSASFRWKDIYVAGQSIGTRIENYTTAGRPAASAGTKGRQYYDTTEDDVYVDRGGTWNKMSIERYYNEDASGWTGSVATVTYTVSSEMSDARRAVWVFKNNSNAYEQLAVEITMTQTQVTVTAGFNLPAGTYTLVGIG